MRILHISTRLIQGGSQENTVLSCEGQARHGNEVHLAFGPIFGPEGSMLERVRAFRTRDGRAIRTHEVPSMVREINPRKDRRCLGQLRRLIREVEPDIVHTHSSKAGILGRMAAWKEGGAQRRIGIVHTIHGPPFHRYESAWRNAMYVMAERFAARRCHEIVGVCDAMCEQFKARGIGRPEQYTTVYSGMEVDRYLRAPEPGSGETRGEVRASLALDERDVVIGTVSRLAELKGHDDVLDALAEDMRRHERWKLLWVGDGWWRERLEARVRQMGLDGRVVLTGMVPTERVAPMIRAMDVLVHPSYREGLPRVVPQALLCAVPVVAYDVDGTGEACIDFQTGRLVAPGDTSALREAVGWMIEHPDLAERTADEGRRICRRRFSAERMVKDLERVYARAMGLDHRTGHGTHDEQ